jgi:hypothetical protein
MNASPASFYLVCLPDPNNKQFAWDWAPYFENRNKRKYELQNVSVIGTSSRKLLLSFVTCVGSGEIGFSS